MARIDLNKIKKIDKNRYYVHEEIIATYSIFEQSGEKYFQIDTYGRSDRDIPEKVSQTIQLDRISAKFLVNLLVKEFDLK